MLRSLGSLRFGFKVLRKNNGVFGSPLANMDMFYLTDDNGKLLSFWNDIPHKMVGDTVNCCIEVPKEKSNKFEVIKEIPFHPFMQDTKKNVFTKQLELRYYAQFPLFNYGFIPRTWEQTLVKDELGLFGDDDPIDICDLTQTPKAIGQVFRGKVLGSFCLIDQGELDWKILVVDEAEAQRQRINGLWDYPKQQIQAIMEWFKTIKMFDGKKANTIAYEEKVMSRDATLNVIYDTHIEWKKLVGSSDPVYASLRDKFCLTDFKLEDD